jgi:predicted permease
MLPRIARAVINRVAPADWQESIAGDLEEERGRRRAAGRRAGWIWAAGAALSASIRLRLEHRADARIARAMRLPFADALRFELRQAVRALAQRPGFTLVAVLTLTLGIGANTAVFSLANWLILRPVPGVSDPDGLVTVRLEFPGGKGFYTMSVPEYRNVAGLRSLASTGGVVESSFHVVTSPGAAPIRVEGGVATTNYFDVLRQRMRIGRAFGVAEDDPGRAGVAVVSDFFWRQTLGGDPAVIGRRMLLNGHPFEIVGVAARGFRGPDRSGRADVWVPLASFRQSMASYPENLYTGTAGIFFSLIARPAAGAPLDQIRAEIKQMQADLIAASPKSRKYKSAEFAAHPGLDVPIWQREGLRRIFALLLATVGLLLVLTCANAANLLFARARERHAELATRQALGASRARIVRQVLVEGLLVAGLGGVLALGDAAAMGTWINGLVIANNLPALSAVELDWRVFAFALALSGVTCVAAALLPAVMASRADVIGALRESGRGHSGGGRRIRRVLTAVQVAVAVTLLSTGALLVRSMIARYHVPLGYDTASVLAFSVDTSVQGYARPKAEQYFRDALETLRQQPGVSGTGLAWIQPFRMIGGGISLAPPGQPDATPVSADTNLISAGFLPTIGARFTAGRDFTPAESFHENPAGGVLILNETMARDLFGTTDVVGRQLVDPSERDIKTYSIVGVIADIRTRSVSYEPVRPTAYQPYGQSFLSGWGTFHLRLAAPAPVVTARVREAMRQLDAQLPIYDIELLSERVDRFLAEPRLIARTVAGFAILAAIVAALGLYGVLARGVAERRREFSIRAALGARPLIVARLVTREALLLTAAGAVVGVLAAGWLSKAIETRLFGVTPLDPVSLGSAVVLVIAIGLLSAAGPARRAAQVDLVKELR